MAKPATKEVAPVNAALPAHLQGGKHSKLGNLDQSDLIIPRVKLLQALSPEVVDIEGCRPGRFWHSLAAQDMGESVLFIPIVIKKTFVLWAPRNDERGILARANDGIHWAPPNEEFRVRPKGAPKDVVWVTKDTVSASGLAEFGSSIPGDANSPPAASLTYNILMYFPEAPDLSPSVIINTRSAVKHAKALISKIEHRPTDHFGQKFMMTVMNDKSAEGPFFNYNYSAAGWASEEEYATCSALYARFKETEFRATDEQEETVSNASADVPF
jgi:hypothetical protein